MAAGNPFSSPPVRTSSRDAAFVSFALLTLVADAQIFADFEVSAGGSPIGTFRARLDFDKAPRTCANFIGLATGQRPWVDVTTNEIIKDQPFFDGLIFHRLDHDFVIQGGSSNGLGNAGSGYVIQDEFHPGLRHSGRYILSMAKTANPGSGNSQFFITLEQASFLDDKHSVFGEVIGGRDIIDDFADPNIHPTDRSVAGAPANDPNYSDRPVAEIRMDSVTITGPSLSGFDIHDSSLELPAFRVVQPAPSRNSAAASFTTTFDRIPQHDYLYGFSFNLTDWSAFRNILSIDGEAGYDFTATGLTTPRFFARIEAVDYGFLQNPSTDSIPPGATITFTSRSGETLSLTPDGSGTGTWTSSSGGSGNLITISITDQAPQTGAFLSTATQIQFLPLLALSFELDSPGDPANRASHSMLLDFRDELGGWSDGSAWTIDAQLDGIPFRHEFSITEGP